MSGLSFEMPNLLNFPADKLSFDLILEIMDKLKQEAVPELMKTNRRFRLILRQEPARIFGKQIHTVHTNHTNRGTGYGQVKKDTTLLNIEKSSESMTLEFELLSPAVLLLSLVERCSVLEVSSRFATRALDWEELSELKKFFANLKQVDELYLSIRENSFKDCLRSFKAEVTNQALLEISGVDKKEQKLWLSLINGSLQNCKMITLGDNSIQTFFDRTLHAALSKTQLELLMILPWPKHFGWTIGLILDLGIPSANKEAACFVRCERGFGFNGQEIKNFPGICSAKKRTENFIKDTMMEMLSKHDLAHHTSRANSIDCYWKRIDEGRDCIYVVAYTFFFAKYVSSIQ